MKKIQDSGHLGKWRLQRLRIVCQMGTIKKLICMIFRLQWGITHLRIIKTATGIVVLTPAPVLENTCSFKCQFVELRKTDFFVSTILIISSWMFNLLRWTIHQIQGCNKLNENVVLFVYVWSNSFWDIFILNFAWRPSWKMEAPAALHHMPNGHHQKS